MKNVVKLPRNAINRSNSGNKIATTTQAAVTPTRAINRPTVFLLAARATNAPADAKGGGANAPVVGIVYALLFGWSPVVEGTYGEFGESPSRYGLPGDVAACEGAGLCGSPAGRGLRPNRASTVRLSCNRSCQRWVNRR